MEALSWNHDGKYEHELIITFDTTAMTIEAVQVLFLLQVLDINCKP